MKLHGNFIAIRPSAKKLADAFNAPICSDGAYARVIPHTDYSVLKATTCEASNLLFNTLISLKSKNSLQLPAVLRKAGPLLTDDLGQTYCVWELERLFESRDADALQVARIHGKAALGKLKPAYLTQLARLSSNYLTELQSALREEQAHYGDESDWRASVEIATAMSVRTFGELSETFGFLAHFIKHHEVSLDLLGTGNILLNKQAAHSPTRTGGPGAARA